MSTKRKLLVVYLIIIHILLAFILLKSDFISQVHSRLVSNNITSELTPHFNRMLTYHKRMDGNVPDGAVILIGNSITQGLAVSAVFPKSVNYGIGSDTTIGVLERLSDYKSISRAKAIVIAVGVNDLSRRNNDEIIKNYKKILNKLPNNIPVIASAVLPVDEIIKNKTGRNNRISDLNVALDSLCENYINVHFVNPSKLLIDSDNNLSTLYHVGDGVHLNTKGYNILINELRKALKNAYQSHAL